MPHTSECVGSRQDRVKKVRVGLVESGLVSETVLGFWLLMHLRPQFNPAKPASSVLTTHILCMP